MPPAATACVTMLSTSGTATKNDMWEPPSVAGPTTPISGCSSASMIVDLPIASSAWPTRPLPSVMRA